MKWLQPARTFAEEVKRQQQFKQMQRTAELIQRMFEAAGALSRQQQKRPKRRSLSD